MIIGLACHKSSECTLRAAMDALLTAVDDGVSAARAAMGWEDTWQASPYTDEEEAHHSSADEEDCFTSDAIIPLTDPLHACWCDRQGNIIVQLRDGYVDFNVFPGAHQPGDVVADGSALVGELRWDLIVRLHQKHWPAAAALELPRSLIKDEFETEGSALVSRWERYRDTFGMPKLHDAPNEAWRLAALQAFIEGRRSVSTMANRLRSLPLAISSAVADNDSCEKCDAVEVGELHPALPERMKRKLAEARAIGKQHEYAMAAEGAVKAFLKRSQDNGDAVKRPRVVLLK